MSERNDPRLSGDTDRHINVGLEIMCKTHALTSAQTGRYFSVKTTRIKINRSAEIDKLKNKNRKYSSFSTFSTS